MRSNARMNDGSAHDGAESVVQLTDTSDIVTRRLWRAVMVSGIVAALVCVACYALPH